MAGTEPRMTPQTLTVVQALLLEPAIPRYGLDLAKAAGLKTGTLHPILARLQRAGWISSFWEDPAGHEDQGRPRRRYYQFTGAGELAARRAVATATAKNGALSLRPQPGC